jgi:ankyrin repeat protein
MMQAKHTDVDVKLEPNQSVDNTFAEQRLERILAQETNDLSAGLHRLESKIQTYQETMAQAEARLAELTIQQEYRLRLLDELVEIQIKTIKNKLNYSDIDALKKQLNESIMQCKTDLQSELITHMQAREVAFINGNRTLVTEDNIGDVIAEYMVPMNSLVAEFFGEFDFLDEDVSILIEKREKIFKELDAVLAKKNQEANDNYLEPEAAKKELEKQLLVAKTNTATPSLLQLIVFGETRAIATRLDEIKFSRGTLFLVEYINKPNDQGITPLHVACLAGRSEVVAILLRAGANVFACDRDERNAAHYAVSQRGSETLTILERLESHGLDFNQPDKSNIYPLHLAARYGNAEALIWLISHADVDIDVQRDRNLYTPLHYAAIQVVGHANIVNILLEHGADAKMESKAINSARSNSHGRAIYQAALQGKAGVLAVFLEHGIWLSAAEINKLSLFFKNDPRELAMKLSIIADVLKQRVVAIDARQIDLQQSKEIGVVADSKLGGSQQSKEREKVDLGSHVEEPVRALLSSELSIVAATPVMVEAKESSPKEHTPTL